MKTVKKLLTLALVACMLTLTFGSITGCSKGDSKSAGTTKASGGETKATGETKAPDGDKK